MMNFNIDKDNRQKKVFHIYSIFKTYCLKDLRYKTLPKKVADHYCRKKTTVLEELHIKYYKSITRIIFMYGISLFIGTL